MRKINYTPDYRERLVQLRDDLDMKYGRETRQKILAEIDRSLKHLKQYPFLGISVRAMYGIDCDYYFIHITKNVIFYEVDEQEIKILNMYNEREDYIIKFLGRMARMQEKETEWLE